MNENQNETSEENLRLLEEINDQELESLECPTYASQEAEWTAIMSQLSREKVVRLLDTVNYDLVEMKFFFKSCGVINRIFILDVVRQTYPCQQSEGLHAQPPHEQLILRICNPHKFWANGRNENEIAMLKYLGEHTSIPVPRILSYSIEKSISLIGCQYILMEKMPGILLSDFIERLDDINEFPQKIIDQMLEYIRELQHISPPNMDQNLIGFFSFDLHIVKLLQDGPPVNSCETFFEFIDQQLAWCVKEMRKMKKYVPLSDDLEQMRSELGRVVNENSHLDRLNFNDRMTVSHGDLNATNILIDPHTHEITGIIDWDFCSHGFDCYQFDFFKYWFDKAELREAMRKRIDALVKRLEWTEPQHGSEFRKYLFTLTSDANQLGFYCSTWFYSWKNPHIGVRVHINTYANLVREGLKRWPEIMSQLRNYKRAYLDASF